MAQPKKESKWLEYPQMEIQKFAAPKLLKDDYVVIASTNQDEGLYTYHLSKNKWYLIWKYPLGVEPLRHTILIDDQASKIYLYNTIPSACDCFYEIDINSKAHTAYRGTVHGLPEGLGNESGGCALMAKLNGSIHAIGGYTNCYHSVWHPSDATVDMFKQYPISNRPTKTGLYGHALIRNESKLQLIILGGNSSMMFGGYLKDIWVCNVQLMEWEKLKDVQMPHKMFYFGYIRIKDERYGNKVITIGGKTSGGLINEIWILDLDDWEWTKSERKAPKKAMYYAVKTKYNEIHLFEMNKALHWKIKLSELLSSKVSQRKNGNHLKAHSKSSRGSFSRSSSQSQIDLDIITSLKANLVQEKKSLRKLKQENEQLDHEKKEQEDNNMVLLQQNEKLKQDLEALQIAYDELNKNFIEQENELNKVNDEYKEMNEKYEILLEQQKRRTLDDTSGYKQWSYKDIVIWISYLEIGRFEKYESDFLENMKKENIKGVHLTDLDKHDIHRLGCHDYEDKKALLTHFQSLLK